MSPRFSECLTECLARLGPQRFDGTVSPKKCAEHCGALLELFEVPPYPFPDFPVSSDSNMNHTCERSMLIALACGIAVWPQMWELNI